MRLKNGGWVEGDVLEVQPGQSVSVRTSDGTVRQIPWADVERVDEQAAPAPAPTPEPAPEQAATATPPPEPAKRSVPLSLEDPNVVDVAFAVEERKVYLIGMPRTDATTVAIRFERPVRDAPPPCEEVTMTIDGTASRLPAQHKVVEDRFATREIIQVKTDLETVKRMSTARDVSFELCGVTRQFTMMHGSPMKRFVAEFERNIGKAVIVQAPARTQWGGAVRESRSRARRAPEDEYEDEDEPVAEGYREHRGFMLRLTTGLGYAAMTESVTYDPSIGFADNESQLSVTGPTIPLSVDLGGAVSPNFNLHARFSFFTMFAPSLEADGQEYEVDYDASLSGIMLGGGFTYYFMPVNFYLTGVLGAGFVTARSADEESRSSDAGFAFNFDLGKEWWVGGSWGLGFAGRLYYSSTSFNVPGLAKSEQSTIMFGAVMSATMQ